VVRESGARNHVSRLARVMTSTTGGDDDDDDGPADFFDSAEDNEDDFVDSADDDDEDDEDKEEADNALCADTRGTACRKGRRCGMTATCVLATPSASAMATIRSMAAPRIHVLGWHSSGAHFCGSVHTQRWWVVTRKRAMRISIFHTCLEKFKYHVILESNIACERGAETTDD
jgi:hypothetical protein